MRTHEPQDARIRAGDHVRVKQSDTDIAYEDIILDTSFQDFKRPYGPVFVVV